MTHRIPANISETEFDLIIIGAGINGAGIARDAAMRGLQVLLLDKADVGGGTTSCSTRLIHGGLRYLEHGELNLVRESLREREVLFRIAPHLVKPLPILIPIYKYARRGRLTIRAGMVAYDLLSPERSLPRHRMLSRAAALQQAPGLNPAALLGASIYYDAQVEFAERLALENVLSAQEHGATVFTYAKVNGLISEAGAVRGVRFLDELAQQSHSASAPIVINAAGPWVDQVLANKHQPFRRLIGGTKGSHIIVAAFSGAPSRALYVEAAADQRPFFIIPWNGNYLIGTTDTRYDDDLDKVEIAEHEIDYLLQETNRVIPRANLTRKSILFTYAGVRPLPYVGDRVEERITRRHFIHEHQTLAGFISIVGGKLTTYRNLAQQTVDLIFRKLGARSPRCLTAQTPLPGAATSDFASFSEDFKQESPLSEVITDRLLRIYGMRATSVLQLVSEDIALARVFSRETGAIAAEVVFSFEHELAQTLTDCLLRRTMVGLEFSMGVGDDEVAAGVAQKHLGWTESRVAKEVTAYRNYVERFRLHTEED